MDNKKGISTIVVTVILVALVLVAVAIVWAVVNNLITKSTGTVEISGKCVSVDVKATSVNCSTPSACVVNLERSGSSTDELSGVKFVFRNDTDNSAVLDVPGNIELLVGKKVTIDSTLGAPDTLEMTVYFEDASGEENLCQQTNSFSF